MNIHKYYTMKIYKKYSRALILLLITSSIFFETTQAQNRKKVDSLLKVLKTTKSDTSKVNLLLKVGSIYKNIIPDTTLYYYNLALTAAIMTNSKKHNALCLGNIGSLYQKRGAFDKAIEYYLKSLKIYEELVDKIGISMCYISIGMIQQDQGMYDIAIVNILAVI